MAPDSFVPVAAVSDVAPGRATTIRLAGREIALFNVAGRFYALDNTCPHQGGPLAEGWTDDDSVTCPWHAWTFSLRDGQLTLGSHARVDTFEVRVQDDVVWVDPTPRPVADP